MRSLLELKKSWFINMDSDGFPPPRRPADSGLTTGTDGNRVLPLLDGETYMKRWHALAIELQGRPAGAQIWHAGWRLDDVPLLGNSVPASKVLPVFQGARDAGVKIRVLVSNHQPFSQSLNLGLSGSGPDVVAMENQRTISSAHQKFTVFIRANGSIAALLGSIDLSATRWDTLLHKKTDTERLAAGPTHDFGVEVNGPAAWDVAAEFRRRWRANQERQTRFSLLTKIASLPDLPPRPNGASGSAAVQVLTTHRRGGGPVLSFGHFAQEFTIWAAYLNAIRNAKRYVYIEDQYFLPFLSSVSFVNGARQQRFKDLKPQGDLFFELRNALNDNTRNVDVIVLVPGKGEDGGRFDVSTGRQRADGISYLEASPNAPSRLRVLSRIAGTQDVPAMVHSKLLIVDDEYAIVGSQNFGQRSMTYDSELSIGVVDAAAETVADLRRLLWSHLLGRPLASVAALSLDEAINAVKNDHAVPSEARVYNKDALANSPYWDDATLLSLDWAHQPYDGPPWPQ